MSAMMYMLVIDPHMDTPIVWGEHTSLKAIMSWVRNLATEYSDCGIQELIGDALYYNDGESLKDFVKIYRVEELDIDTDSIIEQWKRDIEEIEKSNIKRNEEDERRQYERLKKKFEPASNSEAE